MFEAEAAPRPQFGRLKRAGDGGGPTHGFQHAGTLGEMVPIILVNLVLTIITLGIYRFWAITKVRDYLWGRTSFLGDPLEYTGRGRELFIGFVIAAVVVLIPLGAIQTISGILHAGGDNALAAVFDGLYAVLIACLWPMAVFRARRYRLSRTVWRGIRGAQTGSTIGFALRWLGWGLANLLTLGLLLPSRNVAIESYKLNNTYFGDKPFCFDAPAGPLYRSWLPAWLCGLAAVAITAVPVGLLTFDAIQGAPADLSPEQMGRMAGPILGVGAVTLLPTILILWVVGCWYSAAELRYLVGNTAYQGLAFRCDVSTGRLIRLTFGNWLISLLTLGIAKPYTLVRVARVAADTTEVVGEPDFSRVRQTLDRGPGMGEGLASALSVGEF